MDDLEPMRAMWAEPDIVRYIGDGEPLDEDAVWAKLMRMAGMWPLLGFGFWAVEEAHTGRLVGEIGFLDRRRSDGRPPHPETGWALSAAGRGKGYADEALSAVLAWADERFERTICVMLPGNEPSIALATRHGYREIEPVVSKGRTMVVMERARRDD
jgi:RimJ/RimL family protein N-acetyltransferase